VAQVVRTCPETGQGDLSKAGQVGRACSSETWPQGWMGSHLSGLRPAVCFHMVEALSKSSQAQSSCPQKRDGLDLV
jgi:hypothetical protein